MLVGFPKELSIGSLAAATLVIVGDRLMAARATGAYSGSLTDIGQWQPLWLSTSNNDMADKNTWSIIAEDGPIEAPPGGVDTANTGALFASMQAVCSLVRISEICPITFIAPFV